MPRIVANYRFPQRAAPGTNIRKFNLLLDGRPRLYTQADFGTHPVLAARQQVYQWAKRIGVKVRSEKTDRGFVAQVIR